MKHCLGPEVVYEVVPVTMELVYAVPEPHIYIYRHMPPKLVGFDIRLRSWFVRFLCGLSRAGPDRSGSRVCPVRG